MDPLRAMAAYYVATGIWPLVSLRTFMWVTGPKADRWLVKTFGLLVAGIGLVLVRDDETGDRRAARRLGITVATTLAAAEAWFVARGRISPVYLLDAMVELGFAAALLAESARPVTPREG
ncbi:MAG TPA: hypothetical protein VNW68_00210 [Candidatus Limnocylindria bacterium]|jgi:hypothetical protein|nr:hypothetical protein [Candidatus Limnocylindria bacterium]